MILRGLQPNNPLGFLAALGVIKVLDHKYPEYEWKMRWKQYADIETTKKITENELENMLLEEISVNDLMYEKFKKNYPPSNEEDYAKFMKFMIGATLNETYDVKRVHDFAVGFSLAKNSDVEETDFRFLTGSATLFGTAIELIKEIKDNRQKIHDTLFDEWKYSDNKRSMNWDPILLQREHAKFPVNPKKGDTPSPTMHGANRLALEALPLFPVILSLNGVKTIGWIDKKFIWPIWNQFADLNEIKGMLSINYSIISTKERESIGIKLYSSKKMELYKGRQIRFTPATIITK